MILNKSILKILLGISSIIFIVGSTVVVVDDGSKDIKSNPKKIEEPMGTSTTTLPEPVIIPPTIIIREKEVETRPPEISEPKEESPPTTSPPAPNPPEENPPEEPPEPPEEHIITACIPYIGVCATL